MSFINSVYTSFMKKRLEAIDSYARNAEEIQHRQWEYLVRKGANTEYGRKYRFADIRNEKQYREQVPVITYPILQKYVERLMKGENRLLWPERIQWFSKSSGTTAARSKFIPVSEEILKGSQFQGGKDVIAIFNHLYPDSPVFKGKTLALGGSSEVRKDNNNCRYGDLSAIMISNTPFWANLKKTPDQSVMLMSDWEEKLERICDTTLNEDVRSLAGVPSWFLSLINRILERAQKSNLHEVWPNLELFIHGGISFTPYREQYRRLLPDPKMKYMETYNASEGFFGIQDDPDDPSMLLMLDYGIYYEFMPLDELGKERPRTLLLEEVEKGVNYALIISTCGGLWRYLIGDTVMFTSTSPYKFKITGRTKLFINAFGEELIIDNAIEALKRTCERTGVNVVNFTAAPVFMEDGHKGAHEWMVEFETPPANAEEFADILDKELQSVNSDYEAKRMLSLQRLILHVARPGLFNDWLKQKGKLGGQNKVPQLWNDRTHIEELLRLMAEPCGEA